MTTNTPCQESEATFQVPTFQDETTYQPFHADTTKALKSMPPVPNFDPNKLYQGWIKYQKKDEPWGFMTVHDFPHEAWFSIESCVDPVFTVDYEALYTFY